MKEIIITENIIEQNIKIASEIVENILPKYFQFKIWQSELSSEGVFIKEYTEKPENIYKNILQILEKYNT